MTSPDDRPYRERSWLEVRWRQIRNPPRPVVRAVVSSLVVATILGLGYLAYDVAIQRGASLPGGDLRALMATLFVATVLGAGAVLTYLWVPQPTGGRAGPPRRSAWSAALGLLAAVPIAYLTLVVVSQVVAPLLAR
jgi:hypothetical protein